MASKDSTNRVASTRPSSRRGKTKSQIRNERRQRSQSRKKRRRTFYLVGGSTLAIVFILSLTLAPGLGGGHGGNTSHDGGGGESNINTGGPVALDDDAGNAHIPAGTVGTGYVTRPATSGPHWFDSETPAGVPAPARWGIYDDPIPDEVLIHNLEHGGIGLHYDCPNGCDDVVAQLEDLIPRNRSQFIMSPYSGMESQIAITSWRHHLFLDDFDEEQILDFIDAYQDRALESIPGNSF